MARDLQLGRLKNIGGLHIYYMGERDPVIAKNRTDVRDNAGVIPTFLINIAVPYNNKL